MDCVVNSRANMSWRTTFVGRYGGFEITMSKPALPSTMSSPNSANFPSLTSLRSPMPTACAFALAAATAAGSASMPIPEAAGRRLSIEHSSAPLPVPASNMRAAGGRGKSNVASMILKPDSRGTKTPGGTISDMPSKRTTPSTCSVRPDHPSLPPFRSKCKWSFSISVLKRGGGSTSAPTSPWASRVTAKYVPVMPWLFAQALPLPTTGWPRCRRASRSTLTPKAVPRRSRTSSSAKRPICRPSEDSMTRMSRPSASRAFAIVSSLGSPATTAVKDTSASPLTSAALAAFKASGTRLKKRRPPMGRPNAGKTATRPLSASP
mmetsp:Transcript_132719/g.424647  ORF Transcript_132719/g.424647 Transcript_132719/m.424647 type:complete len:321 (+) Transcript_132719:246-1208(+)